MAIIVKFTEAQLVAALMLSAQARDQRYIAKRYPQLDHADLVKLAEKFAAAQPGFVELTKAEAGLLIGEFKNLAEVSIAAGSAVDDISSHRNIVAKIEAASA
jgi:hypothetical protein